MREEEVIDNCNGKLLLVDWVLHWIVNRLSCSTKNSTYDFSSSLLFIFNLHGIVIDLYKGVFVHSYLKVVIHLVCFESGYSL